MRGASLLDLDLGPSLFQSRLDLFSLFLGHAFLDGLRRSFDQVLRFLQAERGDGAHFLDHFDLLVADRCEDNAKLRLLLDGSGGCASSRSSGDRHCGGGRDAHLPSSSLASSAASRTVRLESSSTIFSRLAIDGLPLCSSNRVFVKSLPQAASFA